MSYLGIDIGTTGCKAACIDQDGAMLACAYREYPLLTPRPGWAELDPGRVLRDCRAVISEAAGQSADPVRAIGVSSQGEAFTPVNRSGQCLANAMVSSDIRAADEMAAWDEAFGRQRLYAITGHTPHPMFSLFKLTWTKKHLPDIWRQAHFFLCFEDLLCLNLGVPPAMGWPLAGRTMLFDIRRHAWSPEILHALQLPPERLARPLPSGSSAGVIPANIAHALNLPAGVQIVTGGHDQVCAALGAGALHDGCAMYATGTVECICPAFKEPVADRRLMQSNLCTYDHAARNLYATVAFSLTGGNLLKWFRDEFGQAEKQRAAAGAGDAYTLLLEQLPPHPTHLQVLPYFTPSGTPYFDPTAKGAIMGLTLQTSRCEILKALLEGVALEMRLNLDILQQSGIAVRELRATGGGARSRAWNQLKADVLNQPITAIAVPEAGCLGAAMLACSVQTSTDTGALASKWVKTGATFLPDPAQAARYDDKFAVYQHLYPSLKQLSAAG